MSDQEQDDINLHIGRMMQNMGMHHEFMLLYGRSPAPGEIEAIMLENTLLAVETGARAAVRPGIKNMLKYWLRT